MDRVGALLCLVALASACAAKGGGDGGGTGTGDSGGGSSAEPTTMGPPDPGDYGEMLACALEMVCPEFLHHSGEEGSGHEGGDVDEGFNASERCILAGLRDGTPGRYITGERGATTTGSYEHRTLIHVHADRRVTFAEHDLDVNFDQDGGEHDEEAYRLARTCTLASAEFFADCLANHDDIGHYLDCMQPAAWWIDCAVMGPSCGP